MSVRFAHPGEPIPPVLIAGIGNILLQDDGFGPQIIARLQAEYEFGPEVELLDIGTPALDFVDYLEGRKIVILLDALSCGGQPGEVLTYRYEELREHVPGMRLSAHQPCLQETIFAAENAGMRFEEYLLIGVVGARFDVGTDLSPEVGNAMSGAIEMVSSILARCGNIARRRAHPLAQKAWWETKPAPASSVPD